jgi:predicted NBD/HSP70 family sugar kinase
MHAILAQGKAKPTHEKLAELIGVTTRTIGNVLAKAREEGFVEGSRPARLGVGLGLGVGVSLGSDSLRAGVVDANGVVRKLIEDPPQPGQLDEPPEAIMPRIRLAVARVLELAIADKSLRPPGSDSIRLVGVASAWPSPIDRDKQLKGKAFKDPGWGRRAGSRSRDVPTLPDRLSKALGGPFTKEYCHALNDANAHALAVAFDQCRSRAKEPADKRARLALVVRLGGGLGMGTILIREHQQAALTSFIEARLIEGTGGLAGELGHLPVGRRLIKDVSEASKGHGLKAMDYDGWICSCGKEHHLEAFASGDALLRRLNASGYDIPDASESHEELLRAIAEDDLDPEQRRALLDVGRIVGRALAGPVLMLDPYSITVSGSLAHKAVVDGIGREREMWESAIDDSVLIEAQGGEAGAVAALRGAALAVLRRKIYREFLNGKQEEPETLEVTPEHVAKLQEAA